MKKLQLMTSLSMFHICVEPFSTCGVIHLGLDNAEMHRNVSKIIKLHLLPVFDNYNWKDSELTSLSFNFKGFTNKFFLTFSTIIQMKHLERDNFYVLTFIIQDLWILRFSKCI